MYADMALRNLTRLESLENSSQELSKTLKDIHSLSSLGLYYAHKILSTVLLCQYYLRGNPEKKKLAVKHLREARECWRAYSTVLTRFIHLIDVRSFDEFVDKDIAIALNFSCKDGLEYPQEV